MSNKRGIETVDLNTDMEASVARLEELRAGRNASEINPRDEYWKALKKHRAAHNKNSHSTNTN